MNNNINQQLRDQQLGDELWRELRDELWNQLDDKIWYEVWRELSNQIWNQLWLVRFQLSSQLKENFDE